MWQINSKRRIWHIGLFLLMLLALFGPWVFDQVNVPAEYSCQYRLHGDFCGIPLSGLKLFSVMAVGLASISLRLVSDAAGFSQTIREFLFTLLLFLLLLPLFSNLLLTGRGEQYIRRRFHLIALGLALLLIAWLLVLGLPVNSNHPWATWGIWLYSGLLICGLAAEILPLVQGEFSKSEKN